MMIASLVSAMQRPAPLCPPNVVLGQNPAHAVPPSQAQLVATAVAKSTGLRGLTLDLRHIAVDALRALLRACVYCSSLQQLSVVGGLSHTHVRVLTPFLASRTYTSLFSITIHPSTVDMSQAAALVEAVLQCRSVRVFNLRIPASATPSWTAHAGVWKQRLQEHLHRNWELWNEAQQQQQTAAMAVVAAQQLPKKVPTPPSSLPTSSVSKAKQQQQQQHDATEAPLDEDCGDCDDKHPASQPLLHQPHKPPHSDHRHHQHQLSSFKAASSSFSSSSPTINTDTVVGTAPRPVIATTVPLPRLNIIHRHVADSAPLASSAIAAPAAYSASAYEAPKFISPRSFGDSMLRSTTTTTMTATSQREHGTTDDADAPKALPSLPAAASSSGSGGGAQKSSSSSSSSGAARASAFSSTAPSTCCSPRDAHQDLPLKKSSSSTAAAAAVIHDRDDDDRSDHGDESAFSPSPRMPEQVRAQLSEDNTHQQQQQQQLHPFQRSGPAVAANNGNIFINVADASPDPRPPRMPTPPVTHRIAPQQRQSFVVPRPPPCNVGSNSAVSGLPPIAPHAPATAPSAHPPPLHMHAGSAHPPTAPTTPPSTGRGSDEDDEQQPQEPHGADGVSPTLSAATMTPHGDEQQQQPQQMHFLPAVYPARVRSLGAKVDQLAALFQQFEADTCAMKHQMGHVLSMARKDVASLLESSSSSFYTNKQ